MAIQGLAYIPQLALGGIEAISSYQKLKELQKQSLPQYNLQPSQQNVSMYEQRFRQGISPEERSAMGQQFATQQAGMYRAASDQSRGQLSSFLGRVSAFDRIKQATQLGSMMASERRAAMSGLSSARQNLEAQMNRQTSMDYNRRMAEEQALGGAMRVGLENLGDSLTMGLHTGLTDQSIYDTGLAAAQDNTDLSSGSTTTTGNNFGTPAVKTTPVLTSIPSRSTIPGTAATKITGSVGRMLSGTNRFKTPTVVKSKKY